ncbi:MAG: ABC transporter permease, partial [Chloroflexi bacterium]|nr:ABC transporter permease [Chloroflexota bacterium]
RTWGLVKKEFLQLSRDKLLLLFVLVAPLLELMLMGGLTGGGVQNLPLAVVDLDRSRASRELITRLDQTDELLIKTYGDSVAQAQEQMQSGQISVIVVTPPGYGESLTDPQQSAEVLVIADGSNYVVSSAAIGTVENVAAEIIQGIIARYGVASGGPVEMRFAARFNRSLDGQPGAITMMLGLIVYQVTLVIAAQSFTRERELGTLEQLRVTPLGRLELMAGKAIPTLVVGLVNCLLMTGIAVAWFDVPVRGSLPLLMLLTVPFALTQIGWGTLISLISHTQQQAMLFVFALAMLEIACSGFMVPAGNLPEAMRLLSYVSSVQHYITILRGVMLRGAGVGVLWQSALALSGIALGVAALAWLRLWLGLDTDSLKQRIQIWRHIYRRDRRRRQADRSARKPKLTRKPAYVNVRVKDE